MVYLQGLWVLERRNKKIARFVRNRCNLQNFDRGVMEDLTVQHLHDVSYKVWGENRLINEVEPGRKVRAALEKLYPYAGVIRLAAKAECAYITMVSGDVVLARINDAVVAGELWFFANIDGWLSACLSVWEQMPCTLASEAQARSFRKRDNPMIADCDVLEAPVAYFASSDATRMTVSMPVKYRVI